MSKNAIGQNYVYVYYLEKDEFQGEFLPWKQHMVFFITLKKCCWDFFLLDCMNFYINLAVFDFFLRERGREEERERNIDA